MAANLIELKSRYAEVFAFSTTKTTSKGSLKSFSSAADAAQFLKANFPDAVTAGGNIVQVYGWFGGAALSMQVVEHRTTVFAALADAIVNGKLFVFALPKPVPQIESSPVLSSSAAGSEKPLNPGGRDDSANSNVSDADTTAVVSDASGSNAADIATPQNADVAKEGDPVSMCTGEEILELVDFELPGPLPLQFKRTYRSSQCHENVGLGFGWRSNFHLQIVSTLTDDDEPLLVLHNEEGRRLSFKPVAVGQTSYQLSEGLALRHEDNGSLVLLKQDNTHWVFVPVASDNPKQAKRWALHQIFDSLGNYLQLYYDRANRLSRIDYTRKRGVELYYNNAGLLSHIAVVQKTDTGLAKLDVTLAQYQYDEQRDLVTATNQAGQTEQYNYQAHLITVRQRASGFKHFFSWLGDGPTARCSRNWGDDGNYDYQFTYDEASRTATSTDSRGQCWQYFHNERNQLIKKVAPDGATWLYSWNSLGKKSAETAPDGGVTRYYFNEVGQLITVEQADGAISHFQYNSLGQRCGFTDAEGAHWQRDYTAGGLLKSEQHPDGTISQYEYNQDGKLTTLKQANGNIEHYLWDSEGQLLARKQGEAVTRFSYDTLGRLNGTVDASGLVTEYQRNNAGQIVALRQYAQSEPDKVHTELLSYDSAGRLTHKQNRLGDATQWEYEGLSQPVKQLQPDGSALHYEYDKERNLTAIMRSDGARYQLDYDGQERPIALQGFDGRTQQYQYDINGHVNTVRDGEQRQIKLRRDSRGRIIEQQALYQQQLTSNHFHYDKIGRPLRASNAQCKLRFAYHANGQLNEQWRDDWRTLYQYDTHGRRASTILPDGTVLDYRYNEQGQLSQLALNQQPILWRSFDNAGRETAREYASGLQLSQQFDSFNRLTTQQWQHGTNSSSAHQRHYRYSALHQLLNVTDNQHGDTSYQYNALDQLVSKTHSTEPSQNEQHQWDSFGNPAGDEVDVKQDRLLRYHDNQYQYDDSGNQLSATAPGKRELREYNGFNQLSSLRNHNGVTRYEYDAFGRRSAKITATGRLDYLWEGNTLTGEYSQGEFSWYIYEPNSNKPLAMVKQGQLYFYKLDQLGTPLSLTDSDNNIVWQANYSVFGKATVTVNKIDNPIRFQGQYYDSESGLHYNHFRYYDPQTGRFISQDPIGLLGGINHYQYAPNHINWIDPLGLSCKETQVIQGPAFDLHDPMSGAIQPVTILPIEWALEGIADAVTAVGEMLDTGVTLAGAATAAIALIPGKLADKVLDPVVKKLDDVADAAKSVALQGSKKIAREMDLHKVACFKKNAKGSAVEYDRQLKGQQDGINNMTVKEYLDNRDSYKEIGRKGTGAAQQRARDDFKEELVNKYRDELRDSGEYFGQEAIDKATELAAKDMKTLNALHNPDMIAGGYDTVVDLGDSSVNQSIGSQWKNTGVDELGKKPPLSRVALMDTQAEKALKELGPDAKMNVNLHRC
ncbi:polymorphic toxin type 15 domain-containing protein [Rheinheimera baltica]|uniref:polymorphic toxin type 15 domain-containing protein n=1 Tax=Rheinheimera baltica TaxID=67576 RepID=UPI00273F8BDE|nr:polymorphic toxin type 15 domain-containing protein [Rheinheimera baltica]MDP5143333.1 polymorphic toxin type 15 domain-containing protein [Rheinheimera baltica]